MALWILVYFIIHQCEGLGTASIKFESDVGVISLLQPTFAGRNVTFTFTPLTPTALGDIKWNYINGLDEHTIERDNKQFIVYSDGKSSFLTILDADRSLNRINVYTSFDDDKRSSLINLILKDYTATNGCGELYIMSGEPVLFGENLSFGYYPSPEVAQEKNASKYSAELVIGSNEEHSIIIQENGVLDLQQVGQEYIFTLFYVKKNTSGGYWVQCADGLARKFSNSIHLSVEGKPVIGPLTNISTCRECIVFKRDETLAKVFCEKDGEYKDTRVTFNIGSIEFTSIKQARNSFLLHSMEKPSEALHRLNAVRTVSGIYRNMSVEAQIYIIEPRQSRRGSFVWILLPGIAVVTLGEIVLVLCVCRKRWCRVDEDANLHQDRHHTFQGIAVPSSNRPHETDATLTPGIYDEIDENNLSAAQAGTNRTTSATEYKQCPSQNSNPYANVSQRIPTNSQLIDMTRYYTEPNN